MNSLGERIHLSQSTISLHGADPYPDPLPEGEGITPVKSDSYPARNYFLQST